MMQVTNLFSRWFSTLWYLLNFDSMMRTGLILILFSLSTTQLTGQTLLLTHEGNEVNEDSVFLSATPEDLLVSIHFSVTNHTEDPMDVRVMKTESQVVTGTFNTFCWAGVCFAPDVYVSPLTQILDAGETDSTSFVADYQPMGQLGTTIIRYTFQNIANAADSVSVTVFFEVGSTGIESTGSSDPQVWVYPNPANRFLAIRNNTPIAGPLSVSLFNSVGQVVLKRMLTSPNQTWTWALPPLPDGIYYLKIGNRSGWHDFRKVLISW